jgi:putative zinc finger/helix-turn-helix YgiT family protein
MTPHLRPVELCPICQDGTLEVRQENYRYVDSGLPNVTLQGIEVSYCGACGERIVSIERMADLHRALAWTVAAQVGRLQPVQVKFLRKYLGWSGTAFAKVMGTTPATVSRWEGGKQPMGVVAEHLLRALVFRERPVDEYPSEQLAELSTDVPPPARLTAIACADVGWKVQSAA